MLYRAELYQLSLIYKISLNFMLIVNLAIKILIILNDNCFPRGTMGQYVTKRFVSGLADESFQQSSRKP